MKACEACCSEVPAGAAFCPHCGAPTLEPPEISAAASLIDGCTTAQANAKAYSPGQVAGATFLGGPLAGAVLLAWNASLFGGTLDRRQILGLGGLATVVAMVVAAALPAGASPILTIILVAAAFETAQRLHGDGFRTFIESGGSRYSNWRVVGIALACLLAFFAILLIAALLFPDSLLPDA